MRTALTERLTDISPHARRSLSDSVSSVAQGIQVSLHHREGRVGGITEIHVVIGRKWRFCLISWSETGRGMMLRQ